MPGLRPFRFGMISYPSSFYGDRVTIHPRPVGIDDNLAATTEPGPGDPVTIRCQVSPSKTTAPVSGDYGQPAPSGTIVYDILFSRSSYQLLVDGGLIDPANKLWLVTGQRVDWIADRDGEFPGPRAMTIRGPVDGIKGIGARLTITAEFVA